MADPRVQVQVDATEVVVGQQVRARMRWHSDRPPSAVRLELAWLITGRGAPNSDVVERHRVADDTGPIAQEIEATFTVPATGPVSYRGSMIILEWSIKGIIEGGWWKAQRIGPTTAVPLLVLPVTIDPAQAPDFMTPWSP